MAVSLVSYGESSDSEPEETSASLKKDGERDVRKLLSVLPPAKGGSGNRGKQPVRIGLPKIQKGVCNLIFVTCTFKHTYILCTHIE